MKRIRVWCFFLSLLLAGCAPGEAIPSVPSESQPVTPLPAAVSQQENITPAPSPASGFVFSYSGPDPQAGEAYDAGTLTVTGVLNKTGNGYTGDISIRRSLQTGDKATVSEDSATHEIWYDSVSFATTQPSQSGKMRMLTYSWMNAHTTSNFFDLPYGIVMRNGGAEDVAYTLQAEGNNLLLTLRFDNGMELSVTGKPGTLPIEPSAPATEADRLLISDFGYSTNDLADRDVYRVLCSAVRQGDTYSAGIYLYRIRETCGAAGGYTSAAQGESWEGSAQFKLVPFAEKAYREAGGEMGRLLTAGVSQMATAEADGHPLILTVSGERVYLELPGDAFPGYFVGKVDTRSDAARIAEEEATLWMQDYLFRTTPQVSSDLSMDDFYTDGVELSEEDLELMNEYLQSVDNELMGQSLWLPPNFIPMPNADDIGEFPLVGNGAGLLGFTMEGKWLDEMVPAYQEHFKEMRNFVFQDGEETYGHYGATFQFDYGECHVSIDMSLIPYVGTAVGLDFCRSN